MVWLHKLYDENEEVGVWYKTFYAARYNSQQQKNSGNGFEKNWSWLKLETVFFSQIFLQKTHPCPGCFLFIPLVAIQLRTLERLFSLATLLLLLRTNNTARTYQLVVTFKRTFECNLPSLAIFSDRIIFFVYFCIGMSYQSYLFRFSLTSFVAVGSIDLCLQK